MSCNVVYGHPESLFDPGETVLPTALEGILPSYHNLNILNLSFQFVLLIVALVCLPNNDLRARNLTLSY